MFSGRVALTLAVGSAALADAGRGLFVICRRPGRVLPGPSRPSGRLDALYSLTFARRGTARSRGRHA